MANLDMTLDDMITKNKTTRPGPRQSGPGPARRFPDRSAARPAPYSSTTARAPENQWDHGMFAVGPAFPMIGGAAAPRVSSIETGTKLLLSNLHYGVTDEDIEELFSGVGDLKSCSVHYDRSGRSKGTAEVVFSLRRDAESAIKRYNNVQLDGMPMRIELVGINMNLPPVLPLPPAIHSRNVQVEGRGGAIRQPPQGGFRGMRNNRGGGRGGRAEKISAEDLDADLDKYLAQAKETSYRV